MGAPPNPGVILVPGSVSMKEVTLTASFRVPPATTSTSGHGVFALTNARLYMTLLDCSSRYITSYSPMSLRVVHIIPTLRRI